MGECGGRIPGPGYALKTLTGFEKHDYTKNRAPAYSLGLKPTPGRSNQTPGPYNIGPFDRNGKYSKIGWTIESKAGCDVKPFGPSPLSYAPEKMKQPVIAYSLGLKLPPRAPAFGPSPAEYFPKYPEKPGYTIGNPFKNLKPFVPPGPKAAVNVEHYKPRAPAYSLGLKGRPLFDGGPGPGPKYYPNRLIQSHAYSFGMKHGKCAPPLITYEDNN